MYTLISNINSERYVKLNSPLHVSFDKETETLIYEYYDVFTRKYQKECIFMFPYKFHLTMNHAPTPEFDIHVASFDAAELLGCLATVCFKMLYQYNTCNKIRHLWASGQPS